jgi:hypothetical protein
VDDAISTHELAVADFTGQGGTYDMSIIGGGAVLLRWTLTGGTGGTIPKSGTKTLDLTMGWARPG